MMRADETARLHAELNAARADAIALRGLRVTVCRELVRCRAELADFWFPWPWRRALRAALRAAIVELQRQWDVLDVSIDAADERAAAARKRLAVHTAGVSMMYANPQHN